MHVILLISARLADSVSARRANIWRLRALCGGSEHGLVHSHIDPLGFAGVFLAVSILMCAGTAIDALRFQRKK